MKEINNNKPSTFLSFLEESYLSRKGKNKHYSVSAFARDLGISQSFMSRILNRERVPTVKVAVQVAAVLGVPSKTADVWISNIVLGSSKSAKISKKIRDVYEKQASPQTKSILNYEVDRFKVISQWYHLAILYLTYTKPFKTDPQWIAKRLGISAIEARNAIARLLELGMLEKKGSSYICIHHLLVVDAKKTELATREFHKGMTQKALAAVNNPDPTQFEERLFSGTTFAIDKKRLPEFKEKVKAFQKDILGMLEPENCTDVYQLNLQLFPLTSTEKKV